MRPVPVLLPLPLPGPFDYLATGEPPAPGSFVHVPFGRREAIGVVWDGPPRGGVVAARLKPLGPLLELPPLPAPLRRLIERVAQETVSPMGAVLRFAMSVPAALFAPEGRPALAVAAEPPGDALSPQRRAVLDVARTTGPDSAAAIARAAGVGPAVVQALVRAGWLVPVRIAREPEPAPLDPEHPGVTLEPAQAAAARVLEARVRAAGFAELLLDGVTGSGKTEVYLEAIATCLRIGRRALVLLPEIGLTAQWLERFARRFGGPPVVWHSDLGQKARREAWRSVATGRARVVVGARSAVFLPIADLGLIVVDEEHDSSFKQEEGGAYHARDTAIWRASEESCPVVLASATPSLETALAAGLIAGPAPTCERLALPARIGGAALPAITLVDLRRDRPRPGAALAESLRAEIASTLARGEQVLLFLNRRGYAPLTLCRACGHRLRCPRCSAWLVEHRLRRRLMCHHCGYTAPVPEHCPSCGSLDTLTTSGPGVERLLEEVVALFPAARCAVMTSDTVGTARRAAELVASVQAHAVDLLIGTQIVAKGHHFPDLTLVGVVDGDLGLGGGDLRAAERSFALLHQVAGRAGRALRPGRVLIQTHLPEHPVMQALARGDRQAFLEAEAAERRALGLPPFGRLAALIVAGRDAAPVREAARRIAGALAHEPGLAVLGPAPAPLTVLRGRYRERLLVKAPPGIDLPGRLARGLAPIRLPAALSLQVDVDPMSFL
jgi:primosomal protein N' (replication factor Y)